MDCRLAHCGGREGDGRDATDPAPALHARRGLRRRGVRLDADIAEVLVSREEIERRTHELGAQITQDFVELNPVLVCVLKGALMFLGDLMRNMDMHFEVDFMAISSYGGTRTESTGVVRILMDLATNIQGRHVLIIEDIVDTGRTLTYMLQNLQTRQPASM